MFVLRKMTLSLVMGAALYSQFSAAAVEGYALDPNHTSVVISWTHFGFSHPTADLSNVTGNINFDSKNISKSNVDVSIPVGTINTHVDALTSEFKAADYFDVEKFPTATFKSTKVVSKGKNKLDVYGDLTIKDITKPIILHAVLNKQGIHPMEKKQTIGFDATTSFKRSEFKLDKYVPSVSDEVKLTLSTEALAK